MTTLGAGEVRGFKPDDVEEPIDRIWHRPLADRLIVRPALPTRVTPNQLTIASGLCSLAAGAALALAPGPAAGILGAAMLLASILLDCADGQLARRRGTSSAVGRILDGAVDAVAPTAILAGMATLLQRAGHDPRWIWPVAVATGASLAWHAAVYDALKSIYLAAARPDFDAGGDPLASPDALRAQAAAHARRGERAEAWLLRLHAAWTRGQARLIDPWRDLRRRPRDAHDRLRFTSRFRPIVRQARWLGFGTHLFVLTLAGLGAALAPIAIVAAWLVILGPLNAWCAYVALRWTDLTRRSDRA